MIDPKSKVLADNSAKYLHLTTTSQDWQDNWATTLPGWFRASCWQPGALLLMQIQSACRARRFPEFDCTNAIFILTNKAR